MNHGIAREYLHLTAQEAELITTVDPGSPWALWGLTEEVTDFPDRRDGSTVSGFWHAVLKDHVSILLQQSDLGYSELLDLLALRFINPTGVTPTIVGDPSNLSKMKSPVARHRGTEAPSPLCAAVAKTGLADS